MAWWPSSLWIQGVGNLAASSEQTRGRFRGRSCDSFRLPGTVEAIFILHFIFSLCRALLWSPQTYQPYNTLTHSQAQRYYPTIRVPEETLPIIQPMPPLQACTCLPYKVTLSRNISLSRCFVSSYSQQVVVLGVVWVGKVKIVKVASLTVEATLPYSYITF